MEKQKKYNKEYGNIQEKIDRYSTEFIMTGNEKSRKLYLKWKQKESDWLVKNQLTLFDIKNKK